MRTKSWIRVLTCCLGCLIGSPVAAAATASVTPSIDALVSSANPANNYGGAGAFGVSAAGLPKGEFQSLLQFDLSATKASFDATYGAGGWTLDGVSLELTAANPGNPLFNASAAGSIAAEWMANDSWTEGSGAPMAPGASGITWNALPSFVSMDDESMGSFNFGGGTSGTATYALSVSPGLLSDALGGSLTSLRLAAAAGDTAVSGLFNSRTFNMASLRPSLVLSAVEVPEPSAIVLGGYGLLGLVAGRVRCRRSRLIP